MGRLSNIESWFLGIIVWTVVVLVCIQNDNSTIVFLIIASEDIGNYNANPSNLDMEYCNHSNMSQTENQNKMRIQTH